MKNAKIKQIGSFILLMSAMAVSMSGCESENAFTDSRDGKKYKTVKIGEQIWMAENLNIEMGKSVCYENDENNCKKYGRLYDMETAMKVCPSGWHLPSKNEWKTLWDFAGGEKIAGNKLKAKSGWESNGNGEDAFGFAALPGGRYSRDHIGRNLGFREVGNHGSWWGTSESDDYALESSMFYDSEKVYWDIVNKRGMRDGLFSVRCIQGIAPEQIKEQEQPKATSANTRDIESYKTVKMPDGKIWMAENLSHGTDGYCYDGKQANCNKYGGLYNWSAALKACPNGWHLPTKAEWDKLISAVGGEKTAGKYLRAKTGWSGNGNGEDKFGFAALPGGNGTVVGDFGGTGDYGGWWSSTESNAEFAYYNFLKYDVETSEWYESDKAEELWSVRCVKN